MRHRHSLTSQLILLISLVSNVNPATHPQAARASTEQTRFNPEEKVNQPIPMPEDILRVLRKDERN
jgi:hypothetical protein